MVRVTCSVLLSITVIVAPFVIDGNAVQLTEKSDPVIPDAVKFTPFTVAVTVEPALEISALGIVNEVNFGITFP